MYLKLGGTLEKVVKTETEKGKVIQNLTISVVREENLHKTESHYFLKAFNHEADYSKLVGKKAFFHANVSCSYGIKDDKTFENTTIYVLKVQVVK